MLKAYKALYQPCNLESIGDCRWQCRRCGRTVVTFRRADGTEVPPQLNGLPPCGWERTVFETNGHYWVEQAPPIGVQTERKFRCQWCGQVQTLPPMADQNIQERLAQQPPCPAQPTSPSQPAPANSVPGQPPGLLQRAWNYAQALARWIAEGRPTRPPAEIQRILEICRACSKYDPKEEICRQCGCRTNELKQAWRNKLAMATETCPLGKW